MKVSDQFHEPAAYIQWRRGCSDLSVGLKEAVLKEFINSWIHINDFLVVHPSY